MQVSHKDGGEHPCPIAAMLVLLHVVGVDACHSEDGEEFDHISHTYTHTFDVIIHTSEQHPKKGRDPGHLKLFWVAHVMIQPTTSPHTERLDCGQCQMILLSISAILSPPPLCRFVVPSRPGRLPFWSQSILNDMFLSFHNPPFLYVCRSLNDNLL